MIRGTHRVMAPISSRMALNCSDFRSQYASPKLFRVNACWATFERDVFWFDRGSWFTCIRSMVFIMLGFCVQKSVKSSSVNSTLSGSFNPLNVLRYIRYPSPEPHRHRMMWIIWSRLKSIREEISLGIEIIPYEIFAHCVNLPKHQFDHVSQWQQTKIADQVKILRENKSIGAVWMDGIHYPGGYLIDFNRVLVIEWEIHWIEFVPHAYCIPCT